MESDVPVQHLRHQGIERTTAGGNRVQDLRTVSLAFDCALDSLNLSANAADAIEHLLLIPKYVGQWPPPQLSANSIPHMVYNSLWVFRFDDQGPSSVILGLVIGPESGLC
jgi:hypothetical protein